MSLHSPIFLVGSGRSGSTLIHRLLAHHPQLAWMSNVRTLRPKWRNLDRWMTEAWRTPVISSLVRRWIRPCEVYPLWEECCLGFSQNYRDLYASDVTEKTRREVTKTLSAVVSRKRPRLLVKITGWPRVGFLQEIFPDALFIHVYRDPCSVANSMLNVGFWDGWTGPQNWRFGPLPADLQQLWRRYDESFVALAAIQSVLLHRAAQAAKNQVPASRYLDFCYETFCRSPEAELKRLLAFAGLEWSKQMEQGLSGEHISNANDRWRADLTAAQQQMVEEICSLCQEPVSAAA